MAKKQKKDGCVAVLGMLMRGLEPGVTTSSTNSLQHDRRRGPMLCSSRALRHVNNGIYYTDIYTVQLYRYSGTAVLQGASQHQQPAGRQAGTIYYSCY